MRQHAKALDFGSGVAELERLVATEFSPTGQRRPSNAGIKATGAKLPVPPLVPPCLSRLRKPGGLVFKTEGDRRTNLLLHCGWSLAKQAAKGFSLHTWRNRKRIAQFSQLTHKAANRPPRIGRHLCVVTSALTNMLAWRETRATRARVPQACRKALQSVF